MAGSQTVSTLTTAAPRLVAVDGGAHNQTWSKIARSQLQPGEVALVGAGPGDPGAADGESAQLSATGGCGAV